MATKPIDVMPAALLDAIAPTGGEAKAKRTLTERRAEKAAGLLRKNVVDEAKAEVRACCDLIRTYTRLEDWRQVREQCAELLGHVETVDPQAEEQQAGG